jgi:hypothetical protein
MTGFILAREMAISNRLGLQDNLTGLMESNMFHATLLENQNPWFGNNEQDIKPGECWRHLANIELYQTLNTKTDEEILSLAKIFGMPLVVQTENGPYYMKASQITPLIIGDTIDFFKKFDFSNESQSKNMFILPLVDAEPCAEALLKLDELSKNDSYLEWVNEEIGFRQDALSILQHMIEYRWDADRRKIFNADNGFLMQGCRDASEKSVNETTTQIDDFVCYSTVKTINDNSYAIYLFSQVPEETFTLPSTREVKIFNDGFHDPEFNQYFSTGKTGTDTSKKPKTEYIIIPLLIILLIALRKKRPGARNKK